MGVDAVVDSVKIPDVERIEGTGEFGVKIAREERVPGVVAEMDNRFAGFVQLHDQVVLVNGGAGKVAASIDEGRQGAGCQALEALQGSGWRVGDKGQEKGILGLRDGRVPEDGKCIVEMVRHMPDMFGGLGDGEVVAQGVDNDDDGLVKRRRVPAASVGRAGQM